ncbi:MAG: DEAD/DEAH box helicase [Gammaproteobacteria bacterium]|nr:DEAD/DEAH box helicase [Gammaproteobacteria bacterium]MDE0270531.1 DEAD/DEAH box helicase [Gammaproteobacteria bacterium]
MIPSTVAAEVTGALQDFLATGFSPSNPALASVVDDFLADAENLAKGPYLSIDLPFQGAPEGGEPFPEIPFGHTPHRHQRIAFGRLARGQSTIVATGTGSGKTECFLYPVLEHCRKNAGEPGIKAILIYPMNALASDQARRIASIIHNTPSLNSRVTAGLYVGEGDASGREHMAPDHLVESRDVLRQQPPDILLTNYKMLDLLLTRPMDFPLWQHNAAGTLRFLVVDELHTFDGAQGTDLACLIRRLRTRLQADEGLVCVGTSATIGGPGDERAVLRYASSVFRQPFAPGAVVGEVRQSIDEFLKDAIISAYLLPTPDLAQRVEPNGYESLEDYIRAQHELFFGESPEGDFESMGWRIRLGERLREHATFVNLLRVLDGSKPTAFDTVLSRLQRTLPTASTVEAKHVLNALCALISVAREPGRGEESKPTAFLNVKLHVWIRELRRMVCSLFDEAGNDERGKKHRLRHSDDLKPGQDGLHLPLVQCRECHATGWGGFKPSGSPHVDRDLRTFYNRFFSRDVDVNTFFPVGEDEHPPSSARGQEIQICGQCGYLAQPDATNCPGCGEKRLVRVFRPNAVRNRRFSRDCAFCGASDALIILGARASSLLSTALAQLFASRHNDDHKVIAFSDNVQDAAHRGSFFAARTWRNSLRAAMAQVVARESGISLAQLPDKVVAWWGKAEVNPEAFDEIRFISEFLAPDKLWLKDFEALRRDGKLPPNSDLRSLVEYRMRWDVLAEMTWRAAIGRTMERTHTAAVGFDRKALMEACEQARRRIREEFGELRTIDELAVRALVLGVVRHMRDRGAVRNSAFDRYLHHGGNPHVIRDIALQDFGARSNLPVFPAPVAEKKGIEALAGAGKSWYRAWAEKVLTPVDVLAASRDAPAVLLAVMRALQGAGLVCVLPGGKTQVWALEPERLYVTSETAEMSCPSSRRTLVVPDQEADLWQGTPCLDLATQEDYAETTPAHPTWAGQLYRDADIRRIVSAEHTALVTRQERDRLQERFAADERKPWDPNLLSATPTLELGVDIGSLSSVILCSVPPAPVNYVQRVGRAGRRDGNALAVTVATGQPHDLYYYGEPMEMLGSRVEPPGIFLNAPAVLERQLTAFCFDCWVASGVDERAVPRRIGTVLDNVDKGNLSGFPYPLFDFIAANGDQLLGRFFQAFDTDPSTGEAELDEASQDYLTHFLNGADPEDSLRLRILKRLTEVVSDRKALRNDVEVLRNRIRTLERAPSDEATEADLKVLTSERTALQRLLANLNRRNTFGFLTDEGLLPNYAFPEHGVTLNSVIFRHTGDGDEDSDDDPIVFDYLRPAVAALGEFAPENEFYAGGRRVAIRRIDTRVSPIEQWRLCPSCAYCENIDAGDRHSACPRCGNPLWADAGQRREMLRLRLVHAATPDRRSRIMDERDDREPLFYTRQLVADFPPDSVDRAFAATDAARPFGFEYIPSATFREMNFGRLDELDSPTDFAGEHMPRKGFSLCRKCGGVQGRDGEVQHTRTCTARGEGSVADCLYLYREFDSEAVRILIPPVGSLDAEQRFSSFIAALELGLRRRFAGAVDHLRVMTCKFPAAESGVQQTFLMLYDTVPGGTGYLKQMMSDPDNLLGVLGAARDAIAQCECSADPMKDGCYRCVYAYRRSYDMAGTSRTVALAILNAMLEQAESLEEVPGLRSVKVNPLMESELEARFVEALGRIEVDGEAVRVREEIVGGKPGVVLSTGDHTYFMEPQADLGNAQGVALPSRPDFLIRPARTSTDCLPIAVFTDGFKHHRDRADDDSAKRMALVRAGYLTWSLTWQDIEEGLGSGAQPLTWLGTRDGVMTALQQRLDERWDTSVVRSALREPSLKLLVRYLRNPDALAWKRALFTELLGLFQPAEMQSTALEARFFNFVKQLPSPVQDQMADLPPETAYAGIGPWRGGEPEFVQLLVALPLAAVEAAEPDAMAVALHLDDTQPEDGDYQRQWNDTLRFYNLAQFLPGAWWTTVRGTPHSIYPEYVNVAQVDSTGETPDAAWTEAVSLAVAALRSILSALAEDGLPPPEVGFELQDATGEVVSEAELAWEAERVAVLLDGAANSAFAEAGWRVLSAEEPNLESKLRTVLIAEESS